MTIEGALWFPAVDVADALYEIAGGEPIKAGKRGAGMALALRAAEVKCLKGPGQMGER